MRMGTQSCFFQSLHLGKTLCAPSGMSGPLLPELTEGLPTATWRGQHCADGKAPRGGEGKCMTVWSPAGRSGDPLKLLARVGLCAVCVVCVVCDVCV